MSVPTKLDTAAVEAALARIEGWSLDAGKLHKEYSFADFRMAFGFMAAVATAAEAMNHHPEWSNVYKHVVVRLTTHDAGGLTAQDFELATEMDRLAKGFR